MATKKDQWGEYAQLLYTRENLTQKEIAARLGISPQTINKWAREDKWDEFKVSVTITKEEQIKNLYRQLADLNNKISDREPGERHPTSSDADIISKLSNAIEKMESDVGLSDITATFRKFLNWLRPLDLDKAQELAPLFDSFVKAQLK